MVPVQQCGSVQHRWGSNAPFSSVGTTLLTTLATLPNYLFHVWWEWFPIVFTVYLDPGARCMIYLQPQQRMVPSKIPVQISNQNIMFFFHKSLFKKALLSHFLGQQRGYPRMISLISWTVYVSEQSVLVSQVYNLPECINYLLPRSMLGQIHPAFHLYVPRSILVSGSGLFFALAKVAVYK